MAEYEEAFEVGGIYAEVVPLHDAPVVGLKPTMDVHPGTVDVGFVFVANIELALVRLAKPK